MPPLFRQPSRRRWSAVAVTSSVTDVPPGALIAVVLFSHGDVASRLFAAAIVVRALTGHVSIWAARSSPS